MLFADGPKNSQPPVAGDLIKEATTATFVIDVLEASMKVPVIVDFWAPWCGPCKTLGPLLEKLVKQTAGAVRLVKVNVDANQSLAAQMRIQSIPAVYAFKGGRPVDGFVGALPESQIKAFVQRLAGDAAGKAAELSAILAEAKSLAEAGDAEAALAVYQEALAQDPANVAAIAGSLRCLVLAGRIAEAKEALETLPPELARHADIGAVRTTIELAEQASQAAPTAELQRAVDANPADPQLRFDLAMGHYAAGNREAAVDELLELFRRNRAWNDEAARKQLVKLFEAFGPADPLTVSARRRLSSLMFA
jgi:putative thioredoxin